MLERFYPDMFVNSIYDINDSILNQNHIKGVILDIDNTLVKSSDKTASADVIQWINNLKNQGFKVSIVSNARKKRVETFNAELGLISVYKALKPRKTGFLKAIELMGIKPEQTAIIGDQIFTDIYGGKKINAFTILVKPIAFREFFLIKFKRLAEMYILWSYRNRVSNRYE